VTDLPGRAALACGGSIPRPGKGALRGVYGEADRCWEDLSLGAAAHAGDDGRARAAAGGSDLPGHAR